MDAYTARKNNLRILINRLGSMAALANRTDTANAYYSQVMNGAKSRTGKPRQMGDKVARRIERSLHLPDGWMDTEHNGDENILGDLSQNENALYSAMVDADVIAEILNLIEKERDDRGDEPLTIRHIASIIAASYPEMLEQQKRYRNRAKLIAEAMKKARSDSIDEDGRNLSKQRKTHSD